MVFYFIFTIIKFIIRKINKDWDQYEKFYLEKPNLKRKNEIIEYVNELILYHSDINGIELLTKILNGYSFAQTLEFC